MPIAPWLNPPNFIGAMSAGADAGNAIAARAQREREQQAERADRMMALEVERQQAGEAMAFKRDMAQRESAQAAQDDLLKREMAGMNLRSAMSRIEAEKEMARQRSGLQLGIASERAMMDRMRLALEAKKAEQAAALGNRRADIYASKSSRSSMNPASVTLKDDVTGATVRTTVDDPAYQSMLNGKVTNITPAVPAGFFSSGKPAVTTVSDMPLTVESYNSSRKKVDQPQPWPGPNEEPVAGQTYQHPKYGPVVWDGKNYVK
jgi:hypothetical protein